MSHRTHSHALLLPGTRARLLGAALLTASALWLPNLHPRLVAPHPAISLAILEACALVAATALLLRALLLRGSFDGPGLADPRPVAREDVSGPARAWVLAGLLLLGAALRLWGLAQDLWIDEIATLVNYLRLPAWEAVQSYTSANQHLLYSFLGSLSLSAFGESAVAARLPALMLGLLGLAALLLLGCATSSRREALWATALLTVSYHHVWFSQSARGYTGLMAFSTLGSALFLIALRRNCEWLWCAYVGSMALGILCLQNAAFVLLAQVAGFFGTQAFWRTPALSRRVLWSAGTVGLLSVAGHAFVLPQMLEFFANVDRTGLGFARLPEFLPVVQGGLVAGFGAVGLTLLGVMLLAGARSYARQSALVVSLLLLPGLFNVLALVVLRYGAYPRSFLYCLPLALLVAVRGASVFGAALRRRAPRAPDLGTLLPAALCLASCVTLARNYAHPKQDYRGALDFVARHRAPGDLLAAVGLAGVAYRIYYAPELPVPRTPDELDLLADGQHAVWLLYSFPRDMRLRFPELYDRVERDFALVTVLPGTLGDGDLYVLRRDPAQGLSAASAGQP